MLLKLNWTTKEHQTLNNQTSDVHFDRTKNNKNHKEDKKDRQHLTYVILLSTRNRRKFKIDDRQAILTNNYPLQNFHA